MCYNPPLLLFGQAARSARICETRLLILIQFSQVLTRYCNMVGVAVAMLIATMNEKLIDLHNARQCNHTVELRQYDR